jgi:hypothetical protein
MVLVLVMVMAIMVAATVSGGDRWWRGRGWGR